MAVVVVNPSSSPVPVDVVATSATLSVDVANVPLGVVVIDTAAYEPEVGDEETRGKGVERTIATGKAFSHGCGAGQLLCVLGRQDPLATKGNYVLHGCTGVLDCSFGTTWAGLGLGERLLHGREVLLSLNWSSGGPGYGSLPAASGYSMFLFLSTSSTGTATSLAGGDEVGAFGTPPDLSVIFPADATDVAWPVGIVNGSPGSAFSGVASLRLRSPCVYTKYYLTAVLVAYEGPFVNSSYNLLFDYSVNIGLV